MIQAIDSLRVGLIERPPGRSATPASSFADLFGNVARSATQNSVQTSAGAKLGDPDVQGWLTSYYSEMAVVNPLESSDCANIPYQAATGAANNYPAGSVYGPDQIYTQAMANQAGNDFASKTGDNPAQFTSQLPGIPTTQAQQEYDSLLALENAQRLSTGQPIDTAAYWSDPGPINYMGHTYTSQELGYAGPGQSSGPEPIYISQGDQIRETGTYSVPGYTGTVTGIQPNRYYTLQQLEQAGLKSGQPDAQFHPGSWSLVAAANVPKPESAAIPASDS